MVIGLAAFLSSGIVLVLLWGIPMSQGVQVAATPSAYFAQSVIVPLLGLASIATIFPLVQGRDPRGSIAWRVLQSFGLYSYGIYYLHGFMGWIVVWLAKRLPVSRVDDALLSLVLFPVIAYLTLTAVRVLSRMPAGRYLS